MAFLQSFISPIKLPPLDFSFLLLVLFGCVTDGAIDEGAEQHHGGEEESGGGASVLVVFAVLVVVSSVLPLVVACSWFEEDLEESPLC